jgi:hypothetical protein
LHGIHFYQVTYTSSTDHISGFYDGRVGVAFTDRWLQPDPSTPQVALDPNTWLLSAERTAVYRGNRGKAVLTDPTYSIFTRGSYSFTWTINAGVPLGSNAQYSDWACAAVLQYSRILDAVEVEIIEGWLDARYTGQLPALSS